MSSTEAGSDSLRFWQLGKLSRQVLLRREDRRVMQQAESPLLLSELAETKKVTENDLGNTKAAETRIAASLRRLP